LAQNCIEKMRFAPTYVQFNLENILVITSLGGAMRLKKRRRATIYAEQASMSGQDWDDYRFLLAVAREKTLTAAAATLGVDQTTVSRRL
jgi:hypothetical protein